MLADLHLHFEGSVPREALVRIARKNGHAFGAGGMFETALARSREAGSFLRLFADCCRVFQSPEDYAEAADAVGRELARELKHAEIYVSPEIWTRFGLDRFDVLERIDGALGQVEKETGSRLFLLLDSVRQWGSDAAERVLDVYEKTRLARIVGFGIGGDESSVPAARFRKVYERARRLGLSTTIHAGEWAGPESVEEALDELSPQRIDHGVRAAEDAKLLARLARSGVTLCVAPSSNVATGVAASWKRHPLPRLLDAGVSVCLSADDPSIFGTTTIEEYRRARTELRAFRRRDPGDAEESVEGEVRETGAIVIASPRGRGRTAEGGAGEGAPGLPHPVPPAFTRFLKAARREREKSPPNRSSVSSLLEFV